MSGGHISVADGRNLRQEYRHLGWYVEHWMEESEAHPVYVMLRYKWQEKVQAEEQKRRPWRTVVRIRQRQQQHQGLLQWIKSWATADYWVETMKNDDAGDADHSRPQDGRQPKGHGQGQVDHGDAGGSGNRPGDDR